MNNGNERTPDPAQTSPMADPNSNELDDIIKTLGLEVSGGDFTQEHFLKAKTDFEALITKRVTEARIEEVGKALSYTTMDELKNRYFFLVDQTGGTPVKLQFKTKAEIAALQSKAPKGPEAPGGE